MLLNKQHRDGCVVHRTETHVEVSEMVRQSFQTLLLSTHITRIH